MLSCAHHQVAILNGHNIPLPPGVIGEVCIRGPNVTAGYLNNPKANEQAYAGGWFHTGDQGWLDEAGYVTLTGSSSSSSSSSSSGGSSRVAAGL